MRFIKKPIVETIMWFITHETTLKVVGATCLILAFYLMYILLTRF